MAQEVGKWTTRMTGQFDGIVSQLPKADVLPEHKRIKELADRVTSQLSPLIEQFQGFLQSLAGKDLGNAAQKKALVDEIQVMMDMLNCRCACPRCSKPSSIKFRVAGTRQEERFEFLHTKEGRGATCIATTHFPEIMLCPLESPRRKPPPMQHSR